MAGALQEVLQEYDVAIIKTRGKANKITIDEGTVEQIAACLKELTVSTRRGNEEILSKLNKIQATTEHLENAITNTQLDVDDCRKQIHDVRTEMQTLSEKVHQLENGSVSTVDRMCLIEDRANMQDHTLRRRQLLIEGVPETDEPALNTASRITSRLVPGLSQTEIDTAYRVGKPQTNRPRPLLVAYVKCSSRDQMLRSKGNLSRHTDLSRIWIREDANPTIRSQQDDVRNIVKIASDHQIKATAKGAKLLYNGRLYSHRELNQLPDQISLARAKTRVETNFIAFKGPDSPLSNMHKCKLIDENNVSHQSVEHCLHQRKAEFANAPSKVPLIRATQCPFRVKSIGKSIDAPGWDRHVESLLTDLLMRKFTQNDKLNEYLRQTGQRELIEATLDPRWGAGVNLMSLKLADRSWSGQNKAGRLLMQIRDRIFPKAPQTPVSVPTQTQITANTAPPANTAITTPERLSLNNPGNLGDITTTQSTKSVTPATAMTVSMSLLETSPYHPPGGSDCRTKSICVDHASKSPLSPTRV